MKSPKNASLKVINPMLITLKYLAIYPPYIFGSKPTPVSKTYKIYNFCFLVCLVLSYLYHIYGKLNCDKFVAWDTTMNVVDYISNFLLMGVVTVTCISTLKHSKELKLLLYRMEQFDRSTGKPYREKKLFNTMAPVLKCFTFAIIMADAIFYRRAITPEAYKYYIVRNMFWYHFCESLFFKFWMCHEILFRFQYLNELLQKKFSKRNFHREILNSALKVKTVETNMNELRIFCHWYNEMCNIVDVYNKVFGMVLLISMLYNISFIIQGVIVVLVGVIFKREDNLKATYFLIASLCWLTKVLLVTFASICHNITAEAAKTTIICFSLLGELPTIPKYEQDVLMRSELLFLSELSAHRKPIISAAGLFDINLGMLGFIVGSVTSYIIVAVQFIST